jgi:hypothetical protein
MDKESRLDILSAVNQVSTKLPKAAWRALAVLEEDLASGESVLRIVDGYLNGAGFQQHGLLVLTDRRLLFIHSGVLQSQQVSVPLDTVTGASVTKGLTSSTIKTTGPQSNMVINRVNKSDAEAFASELRSILANRARSATAAPVRSANNVAGELERLAALRDRGVLNEAEFSAQKSRLLGT